MNRWRDIYDALDDYGINVYAAGAHLGVCAAPYCVVRQYGASLNAGDSGYVRYRIHLLVPSDKPSLLDALAQDVRTALSPMEESGALLLAVPCGATVTDDSFDALTTYIDYVSFYSGTRKNY